MHNAYVAELLSYWLYDMVQKTLQKDVIDMLEDISNDIKGKKCSESQSRETYTRGE